MEFAAHRKHKLASVGRYVGKYNQLSVVRQSSLHQAADELQQDPRQFAQVLTRSMDKPDITMESVLPLVNGMYRCRPASMGYRAEAPSPRRYRLLPA